MRQLTGRFPAENIVRMEVPRPPEGVVEMLAGCQPAVSLVSDIMDQLGIEGVLPASRMRPVLPGAAMVGPALTVRKVSIAARQDYTPRGDIEVHNLTTAGDILVIEGGEGVSNMGGLSALTGKRQGSAGAVIWGGCRDVAEMIALGYPVWSTEITPITGVGRIDTEEINGDVRIGTFTVRCGDIVVADADGVCFIPRERTVEVAERATRKKTAESARIKVLASGDPLWRLPPVR